MCIKKLGRHIHIRIVDLDAFGSIVFNDAKNRIRGYKFNDQIVKTLEISFRDAEFLPKKIAEG